MYCGEHSSEIFVTSEGSDKVETWTDRTLQIWMLNLFKHWEAMNVWWSNFLSFELSKKIEAKIDEWVHRDLDTIQDFLCELCMKPRMQL